MPSCPDCGKTFDTETGLKVHHGIKHDGSYGKNKVECPICSKKHYVSDSKLKRNECFTCSTECFRRLRSKQSQGESNNMYGRSHSEESIQKMKQNTDHSGKNNPMYGRKGDKHHFYGEKRPEHSEKMSGENNPMYGLTGDRHPKTGFQHSEEWIQRTRDRMLKDHPFKGQSLSEEWRQKIIENTPSGKEHPNWKGGCCPYYGRNWNQKRENAIQRDNEECQRCGISREEHQNKFGRDLSVHHIIPRRFFDKEEIEKANLLINLMTYCLHCHQKIESLNAF